MDSDFLAVLSLNAWVLAVEDTFKDLPAIKIRKDGQILEILAFFPALKDEEQAAHVAVTVALKAGGHCFMMGPGWQCSDLFENDDTRQ